MGNLYKFNDYSHTQKPEPAFEHSAARKIGSLRKTEGSGFWKKLDGWLINNLCGTEF